MMPKHAKNDPDASRARNESNFNKVDNEFQKDLDQRKSQKDLDSTTSFDPIATNEDASFSDTEEAPIAYEPRPIDAARIAKPQKDKLTPRQKKSRRMRRILIAVVIVLILLIGALVYFGYQLYSESQNVATQQAIQQGNQDVEALQNENTNDTTTEVTQKTEVPSLTELLGKSQDDAVEMLGSGAAVTKETEVNEEDNPIKNQINIALTDEPSDTISGTPTVYIGLDEDGTIIMAGYSAATTSLGYGTIPFAEAVTNERIVEKTLNQAGLSIEEGAAQLPENKDDYSSYDSDGTTLIKENCSFNGTTEINGEPYEWSSVLLYDYSRANASGNLADTVRQIYVYIGA